MKFLNVQRILPMGNAPIAINPEGIWLLQPQIGADYKSSDSVTVLWIEGMEPIEVLGNFKEIRALLESL
jgi:hypothetical protein